MKRIFFLVICFVIVIACRFVPEIITSTEIAVEWTKTPEITPTPTSTTTKTKTKTPTATLTPTPKSSPTLTKTNTITPLPTATLPIPLSKDDVIEIEKVLMARIRTEGVGDRFFIDDPILIGNNLAEGGLTFSEGTDGSTNISTEFPGDVMPIPNIYGQNVWRFRGKVSIDLQKTTGEIYSYTFIGEADDLNLLTFGRFPDLGFVYLRGTGKVIFPDGKEVTLGFER